MNNIIIEVERKTGKSFCENNKIGVQHSNLQNKIIYKLDEMINGVAWLEYEIDGRKHFAEMDAIDMGYQIDIKSCLLVSDYVNVDLKITENENANGIPIFVSTITELDVYESIGASDEEPEEYPSWLDEANAKIDEITTLDNTILQHENIRVQNETTRVQNENERISNENQRVISENQRVTSEETRLSNEETRINNDIARETRIENLENNKADKTEIPDVSSFINKNVNDLINYELKTNTGSLISLNINSSNYVITIQLKNSDGTVISTDTIDLPLESVVVGGRYDNNTKKIILTLENGNVVDFSVADLVSGLQTEITSNNMLESDLVDDSNSGHKFVSASEKNNWNGKQDKLKAGNNISIENNVINATDTTYDVSNSSKDGLMSKSDKSKLDSINVNNLELKSNKVTEISNTSTNDEYPGAKCVYDSQESQNTLIEHLQTENLTLKNVINNIYDLENILPNEIEESNEDITFNNTMNKAPLNITLKGNLGQTTYTGKNLLNNTATSQTINGITFTINEDNSVLANGTSTALITFNLIGSNTFTLPAGTYVLSGCPTGGSDNSYRIDINNGAEFSQRDYGSGNTFTLSSDLTVNNVRIRIASGTTINNLVFKPMIRLSSITNDTYEPYVGGTASPNPNYPQDIRVVKGDNTINIIGKNLLDGEIETGGWSFTYGQSLSKAPNNNQLRSSNKILVEPNKEYIFSLNGNAVTQTVRYIFADKDNIVISSVVNNTGEITIPNNCKYLVFHSTELKTEYGLELTNPMIEQNNMATTYEPYQQQSYVFYLEDLELCKIGDYQDYIYKSNNTWYKYKAIGKVVLDGSENWSYSSGSTQPFRLVIDNIESITQSDTPLVLTNYFTPFEWTGSTKPDYGITHNVKTIAIKNKDNLTDLANFKTWLSNNNTILYYVLATPTTTEITDLDLIEQLNQLYNAYSYHKQTNIYQNSSELPFYLNIKAIKEI